MRKEVLTKEKIVSSPKRTVRRTPIEQLHHDIGYMRGRLDGDQQGIPTTRQGYVQKLIVKEKELEALIEKELNPLEQLDKKIKALQEQVDEREKQIEDKKAFMPHLNAREYLRTFTTSAQVIARISHLERAIANSDDPGWISFYQERAHVLTVRLKELLDQESAVVAPRPVFVTVEVMEERIVKEVEAALKRSAARVPKEGPAITPPAPLKVKPVVGPQLAKYLRAYKQEANELRVRYSWVDYQELRKELENFPQLQVTRVTSRSGAEVTVEIQAILDQVI